MALATLRLGRADCGSTPGSILAPRGDRLNANQLGLW